MSLWKIAWRSIQQRSLASLLTTISMALGVMLVVAVLVVYNVVHQAFHRGGQGYDLIVGPSKGSNLELVLSSVFYIGQPKTTMPYSIYLDLYQNRIGGNWVRDAVPICLGDNYEGKRVVGTTSGMFDLKDYKDRPIFQFAEGQAFDDGEKGWFTAVAGATAARQTGLKLGGKFRPTHDAGGGAGHKHGEFTVVGILKATGSPNDNVLFVNIEGFYRVGGHAGRAGMALMEEKSSDAATAPKHEPKPADELRDMSQPRSNSDAAASAKPPEGGTPTTKTDEDHDEDEHLHQAIPDSAKQVIAVLVCVRDQDRNESTYLADAINKIKGAPAQAVVPAKEIDELFNNIVGNIEIVLLVFAIMIVLVAGIGIMVSIYNSMNDRRHEIAIMRALVARRSTVMVVILVGVDLALARRRSARSGYGSWSVGRCRAVDRRAGELAAEHLEFSRRGVVACAGPDRAGLDRRLSARWPPIAPTWASRWLRTRRVVRRLVFRPILTFSPFCGDWRLARAWYA